MNISILYIVCDGLGQRPPLLTPGLCTWFRILASENCSCSALVKSNTDAGVGSGSELLFSSSLTWWGWSLGSVQTCHVTLQQTGRKVSSIMLKQKSVDMELRKQRHFLIGTKRNRPSDGHVLWPYSGTWRHFCLVSNLTGVCLFVLSCPDVIVFPDLTCYCAEYKFVTDGGEGLNYKK